VLRRLAGGPVTSASCGAQTADVAFELRSFIAQIGLRQVRRGVEQDSGGTKCPGAFASVRDGRFGAARDFCLK
jgi:hypothetical protein